MNNGISSSACPIVPTDESELALLIRQLLNFEFYDDLIEYDVCTKAFCPITGVEKKLVARFCTGLKNTGFSQKSMQRKHDNRQKRLKKL